MSFTQAALSAVAEYLAAQRVATWRPDGKYLTTDAAPVFMARTPSSPDRCVVLSLYDLPVEHAVGLQVRTRGKANVNIDAQVLADDIRTVLHGLTRLDADGHLIDHIAWASGASLGVDGNGRQEWTSNYRLATADQPGTSLVDLI